MLNQITPSWWGMLKILMSAFLLARFFFLISTSPSYAGFPFPQLLCPAGLAGRSQAAVVLPAQESALIATRWVCTLFCLRISRSYKRDCEFEPPPLLSEGEAVPLPGTEEWTCWLLPAEQWFAVLQLDSDTTVGLTLGSLLAQGPCADHRSAGYCFGRV